MGELIRARLAVRLSPTFIEVIDESELHRGHTGWREGGETHYRVRIASPRFAGLNRVAQHRLIHLALDDAVPRIHALAIEIVEDEGDAAAGPDA